MTFEANRYVHGDALEVLRTLPDGVFHTCCTSPPYWGLRDYGHEGQIGLEETPEAYVARLVAVFAEVRRVLRDDGTLWVNLGDSYAGSWGNQGRKASRGTQRPINGPMMQRVSSEPGHRVDCDLDEDCSCEVGGIYPKRTGTGSWFNHHPTLKPKDLVGIPWRVAFALQADGWYLRSDIIWSKPNPVPESVRDRPTKAHEYVFLLSKSARYYWDANAVAEPAKYAGKVVTLGPKSLSKGQAAGAGVAASGNGAAESVSVAAVRNKRTVWTVPSRPYHGAHFACWPPDLVKPMILAGCPEGGIVLDPFFGSGTTGRVAEDLGRRWFGIELNPDYGQLIAQRTAQVGLL